MKREEFDRIMYQTLVSMGDPTFKYNDPAWDDEYNQMKELSVTVFNEVCKSGVNMWGKSDNALNN